jgi:hypothetical protein
LILNPVRGLNGLFEHRQHRCKVKEPQLKGVRPGLVCWVSSLRISRKSVQNPLQQEGRDVFGRSDSNRGAGVGVAGEQPEFDGPIEQFRGQLDLLKRPLV